MRKVLIVEDVGMMLGLLEQVVGALPGFKVTGAVKNTLEARLELSRRRPDVVLLDEILPGESSYDLLRELNNDGIPVILMTGIESATHAVPPEAKGRILKPAWDTLEADRERIRQEIESLLVE